MVDGKQCKYKLSTEHLVIFCEMTSDAKGEEEGGRESGRGPVDVIVKFRFEKDDNDNTVIRVLRMDQTHVNKIVDNYNALNKHIRTFSQSSLVNVVGVCVAKTVDTNISLWIEMMVNPFVKFI